MKLMAIDPGTTESGWCIFEDGELSECGVSDNHAVLQLIDPSALADVVVEMFASYGMRVGQECFETCVWVGRFVQAANCADRMFRLDVKMHFCHNAKAKDADVWQAILDRYGGKDKAIGRKDNKGPLHPVKSHARAALALGLAWLDGVRSKGI